MPKKARAKSSSSSGSNPDSPPVPGPLSSLLHEPPSPSSPRTSAFIPSADKPESVEETATRIMRHMNADHTDSLGRYLAYFGRVWAISARAPKMIRLNRADMTISSTGPVGVSLAPALHTTITFEPQLAGDLGDARQRLIEMDREATTGLKRREVTVRRYALPRTRTVWAWWLFVALAWLVFLRRQNFFEGAIFFNAVLRWLPTKYIVWLRMWQPRIRLVMIGLHGLETGEMIISKMPLYSVELFSKVWWAWTLSVWFEGFTVWDRLETVAKEEQEASRKRAAH